MKNDEAVSPVIGVILMVAITVILAAVVAVFALGLDMPESSHSVGLSMKVSGDAGTLTITGGEVAALDGVTISGDSLTTKTEDGPFTIGQRFDITSTDGSDISGRVLVVGHYAGGQDAIIYDKTL